MTYFGANPRDIIYNTLLPANNLSDLSSIPQARANLLVGNLAGLRNKIINGNLLVSQRGSPFTITAGNVAYTADRWRIFNNTDQTLTVQCPSPIDYINFGNYPRLRLSFGTAPTTGNVFVTQRIESANTLSGKNVTMSFSQAFGETITGTCYLSQNFGSGGSTTISTGVQTFSGNTSGLFSITKLLFNLSSTAGKTFGSGDFLEYVLQLPIRTTNPISLTNFSLVEEDATSESDPFTPRHYQQELALCQRYYQINPVRSIGYALASNEMFSSCARTVSMRATPTTTFSSTSSQNVATGPTNGTVTSAAMISWYVTATATGRVDCATTITSDAEL